MAPTCRGSPGESSIPMRGQEIVSEQGANLPAVVIHPHEGSGAVRAACWAELTRVIHPHEGSGVRLAGRVLGRPSWSSIPMRGQEVLFSRSSSATRSVIHPHEGSGVDQQPVADL